ncbi:helix-turn-helix domain-containing protein [Anaerocolumna xylanovorans]|uniref:Helix-turn-helix domain-containing protein n=1 Tax=Anaerocolumna xylanovorans DSM 12503 TaxID=1121345 RepID=A0A1M7YLD1_9FIRM|nr:helix-turn-helix transcriptional regulator [Anaerocolumna xylanovorans]SHO53405.1 Helix-turn-helix domain-containing protein [Anaerocolumna xylanovorans DSM 12503]
MKIFWDGISKNIIGSKIKTLRKENNLTQKELAEKLQLEGHEFSDLTILRIEQGKRFVSDFEVIILADFFGITTDELLIKDHKDDKSM